MSVEYNASRRFSSVIIKKIQKTVGSDARGEWDQKTIDALKKWQYDQGLPPTGMVDPEVFAYLDTFWREEDEDIQQERDQVLLKEMVVERERLIQRQAEDITDLHNKIDALEDEKAGLDADVKMLTGQRAELHTLEEVNLAYSRGRRDEKSHRGGIEDRLNMEMDRNRRLTEEKDQMHERIKILNQRLDDLISPEAHEHREITELTHDNNQLTDENLLLKKNVSQLEENIQALSANNEQQLNTLEKLQTDNEGLRAVVKELQEKQEAFDEFKDHIRSWSNGDGVPENGSSFTVTEKSFRIMLQQVIKMSQGAPRG